MSRLHKVLLADGRAKITIPTLFIVLAAGVLAVYFVFIQRNVSSGKITAPHAKNRVIVKFKESAESSLKKEKEITGSDVGISSVTNINRQEEVKKIKKIVPEEASDNQAKGEKADNNGIGRIYTFEFNNDKDLSQIVKEYSSDPNIEYAEPDYEMQIQLTPNDPYFSSSGSWGQAYADLWGIKKIQSATAWDATTGSRDIVVAVIDTGIDYNHNDLSANIWTNNDEIPNNGVDDDHNGYIDDYYGFDFYNYDSDPFDDHAHGTHCSGTIGAVGNNNLGVVGVNWQVSLMAVKFLGSGGSGWISDAVSSTIYAVDNGAKVLSNSWGGGGRSSSMQDAINYGYSRGVTFVAAAGNSNSDAYYYTPAGLNNVITVAATDYQDQKASFSSYGDVVEFAAPGVDVLSLKSSGGSCTTVGGKYCRMSGTSMATPHVAGLSALILSANPGFNHDQVQTAIKDGADDLGSPGKDIYFGYGRINAGNSLIPPTHVDGSLIKTGSQAPVYLLEGGKKRPIPNAEVFLSWFDWADIITISQAELNNYPEDTELSFRPGSLVKSTDNAAVYLIDGANRLPVSSASIFLGLGYQWSNIINVSPTQLAKYNLGNMIGETGSHINGSLIKSDSSFAVYLLDGGNKRPIPNPEVFNSRFEWQEIVKASENEMANYPSGTRVSLRAGAIVRSRNRATVYVITDTTKRPFPSAQRFEVLGYHWNRIILTDDSELNNYTEGPSL